ncbi:diacylglycerol/lipid kinase family protein [Lacticaseibacillus hulanensis]|uniref:diacylglycerol/lipid kinase family protein n=1 Tax=Lacticaseibacillus hulanensis TaxID=2493111 RepID=UPI000FDC72C3|nr:diacylglycerol kinase family protein [Lacticaseibacillus hulanensis]
MPYLYIIFNPGAGSRTAGAAWQVVKQRLAETNTEFAVRVVQHHGHTEQLAHQVGEFAAHKDGVMVVIGGDGTLNQAVNGLRASGNTTMPLAYVPAGNDVDFASAAGISTDPLTAINQILDTEKPRTIHIGHYKELTYKSSGYFVSTLGVGLDAAVVYASGGTTSLPVLRHRRVNRGVRIAQLLSAFVNRQPFGAAIHHNGKNELIGDLLICTALVHPYYAGMKLDTKNTLETPGIDLLAVRDVNIFHLLFLLFMLIIGKPKETSAIHHYYGNHLRMTTNTLEFGHVDGHELGSRLFDLELSTVPQLLWQ